MIIRLVEQNLNLSLISLRSFPPSPIFFLLFLVLTFPIRISILSIFSPQIGKKKKKARLSLIFSEEITNQSFYNWKLSAEFHFSLGRDTTFFFFPSFQEIIDRFSILSAFINQPPYPLLKLFHQLYLYKMVLDSIHFRSSIRRRPISLSASLRAADPT